MAEPRYVEVDPEGDPDFQKQRPKWQQPQTDFQRRVLAACGLRYFPDKSVGGKEMRSRIVMIEKTKAPIAINGGGVYPAEFVDDVIRWYEQKRFRGHRALLGLIRSLDNAEWRDRIVDEWRREHKGTYEGPIVVDDKAKNWGLP